MPNPPAPKRRARFQIHLSTAIVLMFVAGGLMWANVTVPINDAPPIQTSRNIAVQIVHGRGWPFPVREMRIWFEDGYPIEGEGLLSTFNGVIDALIALAILFAVWFLLEWLIRRRARK